MSTSTSDATCEQPAGHIVRVPRGSGFRCSKTDLLVLAATAAASVWFVSVDRSLGWLPLVALAHFFLFCNVFRVRRSYELVWAAAFVVNVACWSWTGPRIWWNVLLVQTPLTVALIGAEVASSRYHGWGFRRVHRRPGREVVEVDVSEVRGGGEAS
jgi:hypothetical protein